MSGRKPRLLIFIVAYFAETTIEAVLKRIPESLCERYEVEILVIDDGSHDQTFLEGVAASRAGFNPFHVTVLHNPVNQGYGGNQKIGYHYAIERGFDFVALLHGDGQYAPEALPDLVEPLRRGEADAVFGSRMLNRRDALRGGMPFYKFIGNQVLTKVQNTLLKTSLSEFHSGYRIYSVAALKSIPFERNADVFHFDTEIIIQLLAIGARIKEVPIPTYYGDEICRVNGLRYAFDVVKASLQYRLQSINLFYDRRFDCVPASEGCNYPSKLEFPSSHSRILELITPGSRVLELGSGLGTVGAALKEKGCTVVGCDIEKGPHTDKFDRFFYADLDQGVPELEGEKFDYILALDVIEHLKSPEDFLDQVRELAARSGAQLILTTANVGFAVMRLMLAMGRFEYGKRGILDLTHRRLFTLNTLRRAMTSAGFQVQRMEGIVVPIPFVFGPSALSRVLLAVNAFLARVRPTLFGFQLLAVCAAKPTLRTLLEAAKDTADGMMPATLEKLRKLRRVA